MTQPVYPDFGHDLSLSVDLDAGMSEVSGITCLAQALIRRIQCPQGGLIGDPNYGYDILGEMHADVSDADVARIASTIDAEFAKDERVISSSTNAVFLSGNLMTTSTVQTAPGPFKLVLGIGQVVALIQVSP